MPIELGSLLQIGQLMMSLERGGDSIRGLFYVGSEITRENLGETPKQVSRRDNLKHRWSRGEVAPDYASAAR